MDSETHRGTRTICNLCVTSFVLKLQSHSASILVTTNTVINFCSLPIKMVNRTYHRTFHVHQISGSHLLVSCTELLCSRVRKGESNALVINCISAVSKFMFTFCIAHLGPDAVSCGLNTGGQEQKETLIAPHHHVQKGSRAHLTSYATDFLIRKYLSFSFTYVVRIVNNEPPNLGGGGLLHQK